MVAEKLYTVAEVLDIIPISKSGLYAAIRRKEIASIGVGRRIFVPGWALAKLINSPQAC